MPKPKGSKHSPLTWGDIYNKWLRKGVDHGFAAHYADEWEKREVLKDRRKEKREKG